MAPAVTFVDPVLVSQAGAICGEGRAAGQLFLNMCGLGAAGWQVAGGWWVGGGWAALLVWLGTGGADRCSRGGVPFTRARTRGLNPNRLIQQTN